MAYVRARYLPSLIALCTVCNNKIDQLSEFTIFSQVVAPQYQKSKLKSDDCCSMGEHHKLLWNTSSVRWELKHSTQRRNHTGDEWLKIRQVGINVSYSLIV